MEIGDCVYIMSGQVVNEYKIGKTNNIFQRLNTFRTALPDIRIRHLCYTPNKDFVEKNMHELYKKNSTDPKHEWFKFSNIEPIIKKLEVIAQDFYSEELELTFNSEIKKYWYRELKLVAKSREEKEVVIGKYCFKNMSLVPLDRKDLLNCLKFALKYEELDDYSSTLDDDISEKGSSSEKSSPSRAPKPQPRSEPKSEPTKLCGYYCKHILTKGKKKGDACGRLVTSIPVNLCYSHAQTKNICRFLYSRGLKKNTICAIKIKEGEYCQPHKYLMSQKDKKNEDDYFSAEDEEEDEEEIADAEDEEEEIEEEEEEIVEAEDEAEEEEEEDGGEKAPGGFKSVQENLAFLYKDLCNLGFIRKCSRCKTLYTKNYFVKRGRVCHFCKNEWY